MAEIAILPQPIDYMLRTPVMGRREFFKQGFAAALRPTGFGQSRKVQPQVNTTPQGIDHEGNIDVNTAKPEQLAQDSKESMIRSHHGSLGCMYMHTSYVPIESGFTEAKQFIVPFGPGLFVTHPELAPHVSIFYAHYQTNGTQQWERDHYASGWFVHSLQPGQRIQWRSLDGSETTLAVRNTHVLSLSSDLFDEMQLIAAVGNPNYVFQTCMQYPQPTIQVGSYTVPAQIKAVSLDRVN
jgi:hypothetical protein